MSTHINKSINIKNREAARLLAEIRQATGKGASAVVLDLLRAEKERLDGALEARREELWRKTREIQDAIKRDVPPDAPTYEQIMDEMHDENGLPH